MKTVTIKWHTFEWFEEEYEVPDDFDTDLYTSGDVLELLGEVDETLIDPVSYERDVDSVTLVEPVTYVQYTYPDKGIGDLGMTTQRIRWRIPAESKIWDDSVWVEEDPDEAVRKFQKVYALGQTGKIVFEEVDINRV